MTLPVEIVGELVDQLRVKRALGTRPSELLRFLYENNVVTILAGDYFNKAFLHKFRGFFFLPHEQSGAPIDPDVDKRLEPMFAEAGDAWRSAPPYPDLLSRGDREIFRALARGRQCHVVVHAPDVHARAFRGKEGFLPWQTGPLALSRRAPPNAGLMAVDPADPKLQAILESVAPARTYSEHVASLREGGFKVSSPDEGCIITDAAGHAFYPPYQIHGVYERGTGANLWRAPEGEAIRRELNLSMGLPLVACGPLDIWRFRNDARTGPLMGPWLPVFWFNPGVGGNVNFIEDVDALRRKYRFEGISWPFTDPSQVNEPTR